MGRDLPSRSTRGKRIQQALEDENDADNEFWNQEFFAEEQEDIEYEASDEGEDVVDSDFDEPVRTHHRTLTLQKYAPLMLPSLHIEVGGWDLPGPGFTKSDSRIEFLERQM